MSLPRLTSAASVLLCAFQAPAQAPDLIWGRNFGGINLSGVARITRSCIANDGGILNAGYFWDQVDLDNAPGDTLFFDSGGPDNGFVSRLDTAGFTQWAIKFSGIGQCRALDVATDDAGDLYVALKFDGSVDVDPGAGTATLIAQGIGSEMRDLAIVKLDAQGQYLASTQFNAVEFLMEGVVLEVNSAGQPVAAFISTFGAVSSYTLASTDLSTVSFFEFGFTGDGNGYLCDMQLDAQDNQLFAGRFANEISLDPQDPFTVTPTIGTGDDLFFTKVSPAGVLLWGHALGSNNGNDGAYSICASPDGGVLVTGYIGGVIDMDPGPGAETIGSFGDPDIFLLKMSAGDVFEWVKQVSSPGEDRGLCVRTDALGNIALTGFIGQTCDVDPGPGTTTITTGASSIIALEFDDQGNFAWGSYLALGDYVNSPVRMEYFDDGAIHISGSYTDTLVDRDPTAAIDHLYTADGAGAFNFKWGTCAPVVPAITITADMDPVCPNLPVTFTAAITNGGTAPQYQWAMNGALMGGNSDTYAVPTLQLGDVITCTLTSDADCADPNNAQSNEITVDCGAPLGVLIFSEYVEGSANNKALEIFNPTPGDVDLTDYAVALYVNGSAAPTQTLQLTGLLPSGEVYVIANGSASASVLAVADITSAVCNFNGDDAVALLYLGFASDVVGVIGVDPGAYWDIPTGGATAEFTLRRLNTVSAPEQDWSITQFQWNDFPQDDFSDLGSGLVTGIEGRPQHAPLIVPNPAIGGFRVGTDAPVRLRILAPSGALVLDAGMVAPGAFIATDALNGGVYFIEMVMGPNVWRERLVVK